MKIFVDHKMYKKVKNKWVLEKDLGVTEISYKRYYSLLTEKIKGDRRYFNYYHEFGLNLMYKLVNIESEYKENKSVRLFKFEN